MAAAAAQLASFETGHGDMVHDAAFDYYGKRLATASSDRSIKVFDVVGEQVGAGQRWAGRLCWAGVCTRSALPLGAALAACRCRRRRRFRCAGACRRVPRRIPVPAPHLHRRSRT